MVGKFLKLEKLTINNETAVFGSAVVRMALHGGDRPTQVFVPVSQ